MIKYSCAEDTLGSNWVALCLGRQKPNGHWSFNLVKMNQCWTEVLAGSAGSGACSSTGKDTGGCSGS